MSAYATDDAPLVDLVGVEGNRPRGHIALGEPNSAAVLTFVDLGSTLQFWSHQSARLDPQAARNLAAELTRWADRKEGR